MEDYHINFFYSDEDGGYIADTPDLAVCSAFGETPEEALHEVEAAKAAWLDRGGAEDVDVVNSDLHLPGLHLPGLDVVGGCDLGDQTRWY